jgi:hypothetical protein
MLMKNQPSREYSSLGVGRYNAFSVWGLATRPSRVRSCRCTLGALSQATVTASAKQTALGALCVADRTIRLAVNAGSSIRQLMSRSLRFLQLNVQKQRNMQHRMALMRWPDRSVMLASGVCRRPQCYGVERNDESADRSDTHRAAPRRSAP